MRTIQNINLQKCLIIFIWLGLPIIMHAQPLKEALQIADSLYLDKKFTQSYLIYEDILESARVATPAMLLKMAYIQEGVGNYTDAQYFLNLYYLKTLNKRALRKMAEIAEKNNLSGYEVNDMDFFINYLSRYRYHSLVVLVILIWLILSYIIHKKHRYVARPSFSVFLFFFLLMIMVFLINSNFSGKRGIIISDSAYIMKGPSPGSVLVEIVKTGHRVKIIGKKDVWLKIRWRDGIAYIRETDIRNLAL